MKNHHNLRTIITNFKFVFKVLIKKPLVVGRLFKTYFMAIVLKRQPMRFVDLAINYYCNFNCTHCSAKHLVNKERYNMKPEEYSLVAKKLEKSGVVLVHLTGGEPLLNPKLKEIVTAINPSHFIMSIQTNAFLATEEKIKALKDMGMDIFCVSIDSGDGEEHDKFRKQPGSYERNIQAIKLAQKYGLRTSISTCVSHENIDSPGLKKIIAVAKELNSLCFFNLAVPVGNWEDNSGIAITPTDREKISALLKEYPHCRIDFQTSYNIEGCPAMKEKFYITSYGDVMPCPFIQISFGNILQEDIKTIRQRALGIDYFKKYHNYCLAAEDPKFYELVYSKLGDKKVLPINHKEIWK